MNFREFLISETENRIEMLIDKLGLLLFFEKDQNIFGTNEDGRVVFAKIKNPDKDLPSGWDDEATFSAYNLNKLLNGENPHHIFDKKSIKGIQVLSREDVIKKLKKKSGKVDNLPTINPLNIRSIFGKEKDPDQAPNFIQAKEID